MNRPERSWISQKYWVPKILKLIIISPSKTEILRMVQVTLGSSSQSLGPSLYSIHSLNPFTTTFFGQLGLNRNDMAMGVQTY